MQLYHSSWTWTDLLLSKVFQLSVNCVTSHPKPLWLEMATTYHFSRFCGLAECQPCPSAAALTWAQSGGGLHLGAPPGWHPRWLQACTRWLLFPTVYSASYMVAGFRERGAQAASRLKAWTQNSPHSTDKASRKSSPDSRGEEADSNS